MDQQHSARLSTQVVRPEELRKSSTEPLVPSLDWSVVFKFRDLDHVDAVYAGSETGFVYARDGHPNAARLAGQIARLERAEAGLVMASGMAAEAALFMGLLNAGDHVAVAEGLYGRTQVLVAKELTRFGVKFSLFDSTNPDSLRQAINPQTRIVFVETITNPLVRVPDLRQLAEICQSVGAVLAVDNTFAPVIACPLELGASFVTHSATKMIAGHSDATIGAVLASKSEIERLRPVTSTFGWTANPFESALCLRGMATLPLRMQKACENALEVSRFLKTQAIVDQVFYPGLKEHPDFEVAQRLFSDGFGTIATIDLGSRDAANRLIQRLNGRIPFAPSLGDVATTLSHPATTSHRGLTETQRNALGITSGLVRLSFGIEDSNDLIADLKFALAV